MGLESGGRGCRLATQRRRLAALRELRVDDHDGALDEAQTGALLAACEPAVLETLWLSGSDFQHAARLGERLAALRALRLAPRRARLLGQPRARRRRARGARGGALRAAHLPRLLRRQVAARRPRPADDAALPQLRALRLVKPRLGARAAAAARPPAARRPRGRRAWRRLSCAAPESKLSTPSTRAAAAAASRGCARPRVGADVPSFLDGAAPRGRTSGS